MFLRKFKTSYTSHRTEEEIINRGIAFKIQHLLQKDKCFDIFKDIKKGKPQDNLLSNESKTK